ncbi:xanthine dehydrogenase family protein subunit M [Variovorax sp.]|jgi:aerobic carbon-monoxide dehydrogenase medium subunit|uniref:FAD binding domain-containing protein n=1 Tax=Variovorax TaxID=34072 RepID=UPI00138111D5|nr:xanthine dehydrogenase family protein subunit M [Variovorax sp.]KAF1070761.1 MAG: Caffeine dehydrogenase subunit beta [Variovorax sp.]
MKAPAFSYLRAQSLAQTSALLREHGDAARVLAGGQTLLATLNMRLSKPQLLIDIAALPELRGIELRGDFLRIGALVRHVDIECSELIAQRLPLLSQAAPHVAHAAIRNRGTLGGSIAFADPAAEWPACALAADAELIVSDGQRERRVMAGDFFIDLYQTDLRAHEVLVALEFPLPGPARRFAFAELARRHGDYAIVGIALAADVHEGRLSDLRIAFFGMGNTPMRALGAETRLAGTQADESTLEAAVLSLDEDMQPDADLHSSAAAKRHLAGVLLRRAVERVLQPETAQ